MFELDERRDDGEKRDGVFGWSAEAEGARLLFLGRGTPADREAELTERWLPTTLGRARLRQVHGDLVREAKPGLCGEGDALFTAERGLALEIATADCVPVLLASPVAIAAVHAGWRGIAARVVERAVERLRGRGAEPAGIAAWIGPAIGPCCYEVADSVAREVTAASPGREVVAGNSERGRPRLDLVAAVAGQLAAAGLTRRPRSGSARDVARTGSGATVETAPARGGISP